MYRNVAPILATLILSSGIPQTYAADYSHWELASQGILERTFEEAEEDYEELKQLVFEKMGPDFAKFFNETYPHSEAVLLNVPK